MSQTQAEYYTELINHSEYKDVIAAVKGSGIFEESDLTKHVNQGLVCLMDDESVVLIFKPETGWTKAKTLSVKELCTLILTPTL